MNKHVKVSIAKQAPYTNPSAFPPPKLLQHILKTWLLCRDMQWKLIFWPNKAITINPRYIKGWSELRIDLQIFAFVNSNPLASTPRSYWLISTLGCDVKKESQPRARCQMYTINLRSRCFYYPHTTHFISISPSNECNHSFKLLLNLSIVFSSSHDFHRTTN